MISQSNPSQSHISKLGVELTKKLDERFQRELEERLKEATKGIRQRESEDEEKENQAVFRVAETQRRIREEASKIERDVRLRVKLERDVRLRVQLKLKVKSKNSS
jgi:hypothetical protein